MRLIGSILIAGAIGGIFVLIGLGTKNEKGNRIRTFKYIGDTDSFPYELECLKGKAKMEEYIERTGGRVDKDIMYMNEHVNKCLHFVIDDKKKNVYIYDAFSLKHVVLRYAEILGMEILIDGKRKDWVGRALMGSFIAGDTGALIGTMTAKTKVAKIGVNIYTKKVLDSCVSIGLDCDIDNGVINSSREMLFFKEIESVIKAITNRNGEDNVVFEEAEHKIIMNSSCMYEVFLISREESTGNLMLTGLSNQPFSEGACVDLYNENYELIYTGKILASEKKSIINEVVFNRNLNVKMEHNNVYTITLEDTNEMLFDDVKYVIEHETDMNAETIKMAWMSVIDNSMELNNVRKF